VSLIASLIARPLRLAQGLILTNLGVEGNANAQ